MSLERSKNYQQFINAYEITNDNDDVYIELSAYLALIDITELALIVKEVRNQHDIYAWLQVLKAYEAKQSLARNLCTKLDALTQMYFRTIDDKFELRNYPNFKDNLSKIINSLQITGLKFNDADVIIRCRNMLVHNYFYFVNEMNLASWDEFNADLKKINEIILAANKSYELNAEFNFKLDEPVKYEQLVKYDLWFMNFAANYKVDAELVAKIDKYYEFAAGVRNRLGAKKLSKWFAAPYESWQPEKFVNYVNAMLKDYYYLQAFIDVYKLKNLSDLLNFYQKWKQILGKNYKDEIKFFKLFLPEYAYLLAEKTWKYLFHLDFKNDNTFEVNILSLVFTYLLEHFNDENALNNLAMLAKDNQQFKSFILNNVDIENRTENETKISDLTLRLIQHYYERPPFACNKYTQKVIIDFVSNFENLSQDEKMRLAKFIDTTKDFANVTGLGKAVQWANYFSEHIENLDLVESDIFVKIERYCKTKYAVPELNIENIARELNEVLVKSSKRMSNNEQKSKIEKLK